jgi:AraC-like DNA-binding protein
MEINIPGIPLLLNVGYKAMNADWNWQDVCSPFARIYYVTEGEAEIHTDTNRYTLSSDRLYLLPPYTWHCNVCRGHFAHFYIHFLLHGDSSFFNWRSKPAFESLTSPEDLQLILRLMALNPKSELSQLNPDLYDNPKILNQLLCASMEAPVHAMVETQGILLILLSRFIPVVVHNQSLSQQEEPWFYRCISFIQKNLNENITIGQLAEIACMSKDHFIRQFKKKMCVTPISYILQLKMKRAEHLLLTTDLSVKEIAHRFGMENESYFCRTFKEYTQYTPLTYRTKGR